LEENGIILIFCGVDPEKGNPLLKKCKMEQVKKGKFNKDSGKYRKR
jgi:hypothetical protein